MRLFTRGLLVLALSHPLPADTAEFSLRNAASTVVLTPAQASELSQRLTRHFRACHAYDQVVSGAELSQETLTKLWAEQEKTIHALMQDDTTTSPDKTRLILFAFPTENDGLGPVLARDSHGRVVSYIKCPGLEGLVLACQVHRLVPGIVPSSRCPEFEALAAKLSALPAGTEEPEP